MVIATYTASAQFYSVRVNTLTALTATVDVGAEVAMSDNWTLDVGGTFNPLSTDDFSLKHYSATIGTKYYFFENFVGHFIGSQVGYVNYNVGNENSSWDGSGYTWGVSYGYAWILSIRWNVAVEAGLGLCWSKDRQHDPTVGDWESEYIHYNERLSLIPNRIGVTFNYLF